MYNTYCDISNSKRIDSSHQSIKTLIYPADITDTV